MRTRSFVAILSVVAAATTASTWVPPAAFAADTPTSACSPQAGLSGFTPLLQLDIPVTAAWTQPPPYSFNATASAPASFDQVGYCLETVSNGQTQWVWTTMQAFTTDPTRIGVPTQDGMVTRQRVNDMNVESNVSGVRTGGGQTGYLEMWPNSYDPAASFQIAGATTTRFDADDSPSLARYGSFQVHSVGRDPQSPTTPSTVFAINRFTEGFGGALDVGIGPATAGDTDWTFAGNAGSYSSRKLTAYVHASSVVFTATPSNLKLYPRDAANGANVPVQGRITDPAASTARLSVTSQGTTTVSEQTGPTFSFAPRIEAGLHDYDMRLEVISGGAPRTVGHWTGIVSGDAYLVQGQSNAQSAPWINTGANTAQSPYIRSYGTQSDIPTFSGPDRSWNYAAGDSFWNLGFVGQWPLEMASSLVQSQQVPVAIINGAHGGQLASFFQRNDVNPEDLNTNYGRALSRLRTSGLAGGLSGIFWFQGEAEGSNASEHVAGTRSLFADLQEDTAGTGGQEPPYYIFQTRTNGCGDVSDVTTREAQRQLGITDGYTVLSTQAVPGHDGCHFTWDGYRILGDQVADTIRRDLFDGPSAGVAAPNPVQAQFGTSDSSQIVIQLASQTDNITPAAGVGDQFTLSNSTATVTDVRYLGEGKLNLVLSRPAPEATGVTFHGRLFDGPFISTDRGVGLLAFLDLPVQKQVTVTATVTNDTPANAAGWYRSPSAVTLVSNTAATTVQYRLNGTGSWLPVNGSIPVSADGVTTVDYRATRADEAIVGSEGSVTVKLDRTAPMTSVSTDPAAGSVPLGQTITARFTATDATSGVAFTEYSTDAGATWTRGTDVSFTTLGSHPVRYRSVDIAGNVETAGSINLAVVSGQNAAVVTITSVAPPTDDGWYTQTVLVKLQAPQAAQKVQYRINGGSWRTYTSSLTVATNGSTTIDHRLLSTTSTVVPGSEAQTVVKVDKVLPTVAGVRTPNVSTGTPRNPVAFTFTGSDALSGLDRVEYRINNGSWATATATPVVLSTVGAYLVTFRSFDEAGNASTVKSLSTSITPDVAPTLTASTKTLTTGSPVTLVLKGFNRYDNVTVAAGGLTWTEVRTDINGSARVTTSVPVSQPKGQTVVTATDGDSSVSASVTVTVK